MSSPVSLALGQIRNLTPVIKFGRNSDIDTATAPQDVWNGSGDYTGQPIDFTPEIIEVFSSDAADTAAGTGARTIRIFGLRTVTSEEYTSEDIILNGTTPVSSVNTWYRVNRAFILTAGTGGENSGAITGRPTVSTANVMFVVPAIYNQTQIAAYTIPASRLGILKRMRLAITRNNGSSGSATVTVRCREIGGVYRSIRTFELQTGQSAEFTQLGGDLFQPGSDIKIRVEFVSDNNTIIDCAFEIILVKQ